jgi:hypothetical protein
MGFMAADILNLLRNHNGGAEKSMAKPTDFICRGNSTTTTTTATPTKFLQAWGRDVNALIGNELRAKALAAICLKCCNLLAWTAVVKTACTSGAIWV